MSRKYSKRQNKFQIADKLRNTKGFFFTDTKRILQEVVNDDSVSIEQFRYIAMCTGATLDCFFSLSEEKQKATELRSKQAIVDQLLLQNRTIRFTNANEYDKKTKRNGGKYNKDIFGGETQKALEI